jgi:lipopolysaccharide/colanic/teichoic acid biosynthesis glycosyltransferase
MKRTFDVACSALGLFFLSPFLVAIAVAIRLDSRGPILYRGVRVGRGGKPFRMMKFRTMVVDAENLGASSTAEGDPRITRMGGFLRRFKLDEFPQLINVLRGEMSFVGPRPEVQKFVDLYTEEEKVLLDLRPGITDWASIWNSDEAAALAGVEDPDAAYAEKIRPTKIALQLKYAREHTVLVDLKIILYTFLRLARRGWVPPEIREYPSAVA